MSRPLRAPWIASLVVAAALAGCADDPSFKALAKRALAPTPKPTAPSIDVMAAVGEGLRIPSQIHALQHTIVVCSLALCAVGVVNAAVMVALYRRRRASRPPGYGLVPVAVDPSYGGVPAYGFAAPPGYGTPQGYGAAQGYAPPHGAMLYGLPSYAPPTGELLDDESPSALPPRRCACGNTIAARSRASRCRRCIREAAVRAAQEREQG